MSTRMMEKPHSFSIDCVSLSLLHYYDLILTYFGLNTFLQHLHQPTGMLVNLILSFDFTIIDHTLYTDMDNGVSTDDICQQ